VEALGPHKEIDMSTETCEIIKLVVIAIAFYFTMRLFVKKED
jgi:hypothetical protein